MTPRTKIQVVGQALELGMFGLNVVVKDLGDVAFDLCIPFNMLQYKR